MNESQRSLLEAYRDGELSWLGRWRVQRWLRRDPLTAAGWRDLEISGPLGVKYDRVELLDLDDDGDLDVLTCEEADNLGVIWYENPLSVPRR